MKWVISCVLSMLVIAGYIGTAVAAKIYVSGDQIAIEGEIVDGDYRKFEKVLNEANSKWSTPPVDIPLKRSGQTKQTMRVVL